jgi:N-acetylglucosamine-6-phosphate deacetylase
MMSQSILITNASVMTSKEVLKGGWLLALEGEIAAIGQGGAPAIDGGVVHYDAAGKTLLPGFVDVHVHGADGHEAMDATPEALQAMARFYARHGVTAFLPTTWTDSQARVDRALDVILELMGPVPDGASIIGAQLEGPYLNPEKCGAQNVSYVRRADRAEATRWLDTGIVRLLAIAPEYPENEWLIAECVRRGITVSLAHSSANYNQVNHAVELGLSHATHTFNAMTGLHHREPGAVGAVLTNPHVQCELIADNIHVHPAVIKLMWLAKGPDQLVLVSDAMRATGMPDGEFQIDERTVQVRDGVVRLPDGTLAGSTLTLNRALRNLMGATGEPLERVWKASSLNAARAICVDDYKGSLDVGKDADLVVVDGEINVALTVALGRVGYDARKVG